MAVGDETVLESVRVLRLLCATTPWSIGKPIGAGEWRLRLELEQGRMASWSS